MSRSNDANEVSRFTDLERRGRLGIDWTFSLSVEQFRAGGKGWLMTMMAPFEDSEGASFFARCCASGLR